MLSSRKVSDINVSSRNIGNKTLQLKETGDTYQSRGYEIMEESDEESPIRKRDNAPLQAKQL